MPWAEARDRRAGRAVSNWPRDLSISSGPLFGDHTGGQWRNSTIEQRVGTCWGKQRWKMFNRITMRARVNESQLQEIMIIQPALVTD